MTTDIETDRFTVTDGYVVVDCTTGTIRIPLSELDEFIENMRLIVALQ